MGWTNPAPVGPRPQPPAPVAANPWASKGEIFDGPHDEPIVARVIVEKSGHAAVGVTATLVGPDGAEHWRCESSTVTADTRLDAACPVTPLDKSKSGAYVFTAVVTTPGAAPKKVTQALPLSGDERAIEARISIDDEKPARWSVVRVRPAPPTVQLNRAFVSEWHPALPLRYQLVNGGEMAIVAEGVKGHLVANLERFEEDDWASHARGVGCDAPHGLETIAPGAAAPVIEGHYVGVARAFTSGTYRIRLRYRLAAAADAALAEAFEVRDQITITKHSLRPRDPNCEAALSIDRWGARRIKPECL